MIGFVRNFLAVCGRSERVHPWQVVYPLESKKGNCDEANIDLEDCVLDVVCAAGSGGRVAD